MKAYKEKQYLVFKFEDGKDVRYNLSNGETIGKLGKPVKDICTQLRNHNILTVIRSFEDENYRKFLEYIDKNFINRSECIKSGWRSTHRVDKIRNLGSFLSRIDKYSYFEQYFACGLRDIDTRITYKLTDIPSGLIKLCKEHKLLLSNELVDRYRQIPNDFQNFLSMDFNSIDRQRDIVPLLVNSSYYVTQHFNMLIDTHKYNKQSVLRYIDNLMTYEAIENFNNLMQEFKDYVNMMSKISPKFDKYPKNFLTTHKIACRNYNRLKEQFEESAFQERIDESLEYSYGNYKIIYPKSTQEIKDEAVQQNHCVASYIQKVIDGECHILFLRDKENLDKSLITIEIKNNQVTQAKGRFNRDVTNSEQVIINKYNSKLSKRKEVLKNVS